MLFNLSCYALHLRDRAEEELEDTNSRSTKLIIFFSCKCDAVENMNVYILL